MLEKGIRYNLFGLILEWKRKGNELYEYLRIQLWAFDAHAALKTNSALIIGSCLPQRAETKGAYESRWGLTTRFSDCILEALITGSCSVRMGDFTLLVNSVSSFFSEVQAPYTQVFNESFVQIIFLIFLTVCMANILYSVFMLVLAHFSSLYDILLKLQAEELLSISDFFFQTHPLRLFNQGSHRHFWENFIS